MPTWPARRASARLRFLELLTAESSGAIRRFGASIKHHKTGWTHNAMVAWKVDEAEVEECGRTASRHDAFPMCITAPAPCRTGRIPCTRWCMDAVKRNVSWMLTTGARQARSRYAIHSQPQRAEKNFLNPILPISPLPLPARPRQGAFFTQEENR